MSRKWLVLLGIMTFVGGVLLTFPANVAYQWFAPEQLRLKGVSGSIWNGRATEGALGDAYFRDLRWQARPSQLLTGNMAIDVSVQSPAGPIRTTAKAGLSGQLQLLDTSGTLTLSAVHPSLQAGGVDGILRLDMQSLALENGFPVEALGTVTIERLIATAVGSETIGDFKASFSTETDGIVGLVEDVDAVLSVDGRLVLSPNRSYVLNGSVASKPRTPVVIQQNLRFLGSADANGRRPFRFEGQL